MAKERKRVKQLSELWLGDCLQLMKKIPDHSIDFICCDLPYGTTACAWDVVISFVPLWEQYRRVAKERAAIVLTASQPFTTDLINSNRDWFKYSWVWVKSVCGDPMNAKNRPMKKHEDVLVFSSGTTANKSNRRMSYYPQGLRAIRSVKSNGYRDDGQDSFKPQRPSHKPMYVQEFEGYPNSVLEFGSDAGGWGSHSTQKPVALMGYLIQTYTQPGAVVLDNCMGSGTTGVAAIKTGRRFIGIEKDPEIFKTAERRIRTMERTGIVVGRESNVKGFW